MIHYEGSVSQETRGLIPGPVEFHGYPAQKQV